MAGEPTAMVLAGMLRVTVLAAPMMAPSPMVTALEDGDVGTDPDVVADGDWCIDERLVADGNAAGGAVIVIGEKTERADHAVLADGELMVGVEDGVAVDVGVGADGELAGFCRAGVDEGDATVEGDAVTEVDIAGVASDLDVAEPRGAIELHPEGAVVDPADP
ncbi:MAG: hypothetical protein P8J87_14880 [Verrucomicrobiales bacterium]|nr:hypothetical protein [Verrucomicrobiales bacterium]